jgi:fibrillarin-like pre-rRNA processing protein
MKVTPHKKFKGIFFVDGKISTPNKTPGSRVYGERIVKSGKKEYRIWDYYRSKPAAAIKNGLKTFVLEPGMSVLYLGVASGTTASHFSDIVGDDGIIYGVDIAERVLRELIPHAEKRGNIVPILADTRKPETYADSIFDEVDLVYEDVASKDQVAILIRNCGRFLKPEGHAMIAIKSQSIDVTKPPQKVYKECLAELKKHFEILEKVELDPYEKFAGGISTMLPYFAYASGRTAPS